MYTVKGYLEENQSIPRVESHPIMLKNHIKSNKIFPIMDDNGKTQT